MSFDGLDLSKGVSIPGSNSNLGYLTPDDIDDLFVEGTDLGSEYALRGSDLVSEDMAEHSLQSVTSNSECDDDIPDLESVSASSDLECVSASSDLESVSASSDSVPDDDIPDLVEVSDSEYEFDPSDQPILEVLEQELNNSYFSELMQLEEYNEVLEQPKQWSPKYPVMDTEVQGINMKVLDSENYHGCKYIGDILAIIVRYMLDWENYPGDENFPPIKESRWSYCY